MTNPPDVLFVCVHNAGRSQMAKAIFNKVAKERGLGIVADSAGTIPAKSVHPEVQLVMSELGIDLSNETGKLLIDELIDNQVKVITMGCNVDSEACPSLRLEDVVDWGLPDPKDQPLSEVRRIRDEISSRVHDLIDGFGITSDA